MCAAVIRGGSGAAMLPEGDIGGKMSCFSAASRASWDECLEETCCGELGGEDVDAGDGIVRCECGEEQFWGGCCTVESDFKGKRCEREEGELAPAIFGVVVFSWFKTMSWGGRSNIGAMWGVGDNDEKDELAGRPASERE